ncbi:MAG TPA: DUF4112 domain-containing protein [Terriglobales bacterium]|nr:DUF4112 domain-containing protein [Terriglobales bacterium]
MEPDVLPPRRYLLSDQGLARLAAILDDEFRIPGLGARFGLDPLIGLIPGFGDLIGGLLSFAFVFAAYERRLSRVTIARMIANILIDTLGGTLPIFGDIFDVYWKSNRMNYNLLLRNRAATHAHTWRDWLFFAALLLILLVMALLPLAFLVWIIHLLRR